MDSQLSDQQAKLRVVIIGIFYLISGIWQYLLGLTKLQYTHYGVYYFLDVYRSYIGYLGLVTIVLGILLFFRLNIIRLIVVALTWWNLFTIPLISIGMDVYTTTIIKTGPIESLPGIISFDLLLIFAHTMVRLYIINMLKVSKAGYVFLKKRDKETA